MYGLRTGGGEAGGAEEITEASGPLPWSRGTEVVHTYIPTRKPVEEYLKLQGRFRHLFEPIRQDEAVRHIQARVNVYWQEAKKMGTAF